MSLAAAYLLSIGIALGFAGFCFGLVGRGRRSVAFLAGAALVLTAGVVFS